MAILDIIAAVSGSGFLGGITGLIGNELKSRREMKMIKLQGELDAAAWPERQKEREHAQAMRAENYSHELRLHEVNRLADKEEDERAILAGEVENSGAGLVAALEVDRARAATSEPEYRFVGAVRSLVRPVVVFLLIILTGFAFAYSGLELRAQIVAALLYLTTLGVSYYFGDRPSTALKKMLIGGAV